MTRSVQPSHTGKDPTPCMKQTTTNSEKKVRQKVVGGKERIWFNENKLSTISRENKLTFNANETPSRQKQIFIYIHHPILYFKFLLKSQQNLSFIF